jgi:hypothetical protein
MTKPIYEKITDPDFQSVSIKRTDPDGTIWFIPISTDNSDYQAYLAQLTESVTKAT